MSADFDQLLAGFAADADRARLSPAEHLRSIGDARTRRRFIAVTCTAVVVVAILVGAGIAVAGQRPPRPYPTPVGPPPTIATTPPTIAPTTPPTTPPPSPGGPCTARMIAYDRVLQQGAAGTSIFTFTFHNAGPVSCTLQGSPDLTYVDGGGATVMMPVQHNTGREPVLVPSGGTVDLDTSHLNGYAGYGPGAPECAHPATYEHVSVVLPGGSVSLGSDGTMSVQCGGITVGVWYRP